MLFEKTNIKSLRETNVGVAKVLTDLQRRPYKKQTSRLYCNILYAQPYEIPEYANLVTFHPKHP